MGVIWVPKRIPLCSTIFYDLSIYAFVLTLTKLLKKKKNRAVFDGNKNFKFSEIAFARRCTSQWFTECKSCQLKRGKKSKIGEKDGVDHTML